MNCFRLAPTGPTRWITTASVAALLVTTHAIGSAQSADPVPLPGLIGRFGTGPQIGVTVRDITADDAAVSDSIPGTGAVVQAVRAETPAAAAGFRAGDIIVSFDGEPVRSARQLARLIDETPGGREVPVTVQREGNPVELKVTPASRRTTDVAPRPRQNAPGLSLVPRPRRPAAPLAGPLAPSARLGIGVEDLTTQLGEFFGAPNGVLVTTVNDGTPARTAGLQAGDVITKMNGENVTDAADLRRRISGASGLIRLTVVRDRSLRTVELELSASPTPAPARRFAR